MDGIDLTSGIITKAAGGVSIVATALYAHWQSMSNKGRIKEVNAKVEKHEDELKAHAIITAREYATRAEMRELTTDIKAALQRIEDKLDKKVDK